MTKEDVMNQTQATMQTGQPNGPAYQPGQTGRQSDQESSYPGYGSPGQGASAQRREVSTAGLKGGQAEQALAAQSTTLLPPVDIFEDESGFTLIADLPGVSKEQLGVRVTGDSLVIEGTASVPVTANMELVYGEVQTPQYRRSFTLSRELDPGKIEARLNHGVLRLRIPKAEEARPRRIEVSVG
jgi:HSP20 family molecular chaperone IbpA